MKNDLTLSVIKKLEQLRIGEADISRILQDDRSAI
jgi:hypothetical protein